MHRILPNSRREFLQKAGAGFGMVALADLLQKEKLLAEDPVNPLAVKPAQFTARAKSVIWLFMEGGPSACDTFDPKPELESTTASAPNRRLATLRIRPAAEIAITFRQHANAAFGQRCAASHRAPRRRNCVHKILPAESPATGRRCTT